MRVLVPAPRLRQTCGDRKGTRGDRKGPTIEWERFQLQVSGKSLRDPPVQKPLNFDFIPFLMDWDSDMHILHTQKVSAECILFSREHGWNLFLRCNSTVLHKTVFMVDYFGQCVAIGTCYGTSTTTAIVKLFDQFVIHWLGFWPFVRDVT